MTNEFDFDTLETIQVPVKYKGKEYILQEISEGDSVTWRNKMTKSIVLDAEGKPRGLRDFASLEIDLVAYCLYEKDLQGNPFKRVPSEVISSWPNRIVKRLFAKAKEISELDEKETSDEDIEEQIEKLQKELEKRRAGTSTVKNEQEPTESISDF